MSDQSGPTFEGLVLQQDRQSRYFFWYPKGWQPYALDGERIGFLCSPMSDQPTTFFSVEVTSLETTVESQDVDMLVAGVEEGLATLPGLVIESAEQSAAGNRIEIERALTFEDAGSTHRRRIRLIYDRDRLYTLISQGATVDEYTYWLPMLNYCHLSFQIGTFSLEGFGGAGK